MRFYKLKEAFQAFFKYLKLVWYGPGDSVVSTPKQVTVIVNVGKVDVYLNLRDGQNQHGVVQGTLERDLRDKMYEFNHQLSSSKFLELTVDNQRKLFCVAEIKSLTLVQTDVLKEVVYEKTS